ncbi:MAG: sulfatase-like hydrolase/transferase, partial [Candidatus Aminicenantes bacterium]|nr:sulfatase-like hydrolase/transferase [Candidatus Aminicenantes bacterium]
MTKKRGIFLGILFSAVLIVCVFLLIFVFKFKQNEFARLAGKKNFNYILVTVDTLRVDRIGCYGYKDVETPTMDLFAKRGIKFEKCFSQTPLTLPSHTSLMTGTFPAFHGVRDNGGFLVPPELETLAELFKENEYDTGAFVASYVLDSKWGLNQGFDFYFDQFDLSKYQSISLGNVQRRGDEVIDQALPWLEAHKKNPFFAWIHLYDPHTPYDPPSPYKEKYPNKPYVGEIAYTDSQLARLWQYLGEENLIENTILIFASDHGESLGAHKENAHGFFVYQEAVHVPLIIVTPFESLFGLSRTKVVSLVDILPTMLEMANIPVPSQVQGKSLQPLLFKDVLNSEDFAYSETYYPRFHYGWSELTSVQDSRYKLIVAPRLELYDLENDPQEQTNVLDVLPGEARRLKDLIDIFMLETEKNALKLDYSQMDEDSRQKLAALGYLGTVTEVSLEGKKLGDPKDKITIFNQLSEARELGLGKNFEEAVRMVEKIILEDPDVIDAYFTMGNLYFKEKDFKKALEYFFQVLSRQPNDAFTVSNIANSYIMMNELDEAEKFLLSIIDALPPDSQINLIMGNINNAKKDYDKALTYYKKCMEINPASASAYNAIGGIYVIQKDLEKADEFLREAEKRNPKLMNLHYNLAQLLEEKTDFTQAEIEYKKELEYIPHNFKASFNLSRIYRLRGDVANEETYLEETLSI